MGAYYLKAPGVDVGLPTDLMHFWLVGQSEVWIDYYGHVHLIAELDDEYLSKILGYLLAQKGRLLRKYALFLGAFRALSRSREFRLYVPVALEDTRLFQGITSELHYRDHERGAK